MHDECARATSSSFSFERRRRRAVARWQAMLGVLGPVVAVCLLPDPRGQLVLLHDGRPEVLLGAVAIIVASLVTWMLVGWAAIVGFAAAASYLPGAAGRVARRALITLTPAAVRQVVIAAAGLSLAAGLGACGSGPVAGAAAGPGGAAGGVTTAVSSVGGGTGWAHPDRLVDLDWPITADAADAGPADTGPAVAGPADTGAGPAPHAVTGPPIDPAPASPPAAAAPGMTKTPPEPAAAAATPPGHATAVAVVRRGDSLWSIAAAHLPADATAAQIDTSWRQWYALNRDVIGPDPNLVIPGQRLVGPAEPHAAPQPGVARAPAAGRVDGGAR